MFVIQEGFQGLVTDVIFQKRGHRKLGPSGTIGLLAMLYVLTVFAFSSSFVTKCVLASIDLKVSVFICITNYTDPHLLETCSVIFKVLFNLYYS